MTGDGPWSNMLLHGIFLCMHLCVTQREREILGNIFQKRASVPQFSVARRTFKPCSGSWFFFTGAVTIEGCLNRTSDLGLHGFYLSLSPCCSASYCYTNLSCQSNEPCVMFVVLWPARGWTRRGGLLSDSPPQSVPSTVAALCVSFPCPGQPLRTGGLSSP